MKLFKQNNKLGKTWGYIMQVATQAGVVFQIITLFMQIITLSSVLQLRGMYVPVWLIALLSAFIIVTSGIIIFKLGNPSYFSAWAEQFYKHDNPMRKDMEEIKEAIKALKNEKGD